MHLQRLRRTDRLRLVATDGWNTTAYEIPVEQNRLPEELDFRAIRRVTSGVYWAHVVEKRFRQLLWHLDDDKVGKGRVLRLVEGRRGLLKLFVGAEDGKKAKPEPIDQRVIGECDRKRSSGYEVF